MKSYLALLLISLLLLPAISLSKIIVPELIEPETIEHEMPSGEAITITHFSGKGDRILWLPSEYGLRKKTHYQLMSGVAAQGNDVMLAELHESYFIPSGRSSLTKIPIADLAALIALSLPKDGRKLFIASSGRGAVLSLFAINEWLANTGSNKQLGGTIFLHPNFQAGAADKGEAMKYLPIVNNTQLPIYILQPEKSSKLYYLNDLVDRFTDAGSQVYSQVIKDVSDGYHVRLDAKAKEKEEALKLPMHIARAMKMLNMISVEPNLAQVKQNRDYQWELGSLADTLNQYPGNVPAPKLELNSIDGKPFSLSEKKGKVVVLNFWATWCPPCVKEIPSLGRLQKAFPKDELEVISVDIGESKADIEKFLAKVPAEFPVLIDPEGNVVKAWKIRAFPTTFVIDQKGIIKLAYFGGLEWDDAAVVEQLKTLTN